MPAVHTASRCGGLRELKACGVSPSPAEVPARSLLWAAAQEMRVGKSRCLIQPLTEENNSRIDGTRSRPSCWPRVTLPEWVLAAVPYLRPRFPLQREGRASFAQ